MTLIVAIIRPEELEAIRAALEEPGVPLACISRAQLIDGNAPRSTAISRGVTVQVAHPRLRLEVVVTLPKAKPAHPLDRPIPLRRLLSPLTGSVPRVTMATGVGG
jgi:nitrogen regulatory protein PII